MKIIIEANPDIDNAKEVVKKQFEEWCRLGFEKECKITIED